ncbi:hypothetical protein NKH82_17820 [Mesorhizobium sp. M0915]|uniref:hypothetical protein n=1 Tax=unclassified Mesorhizobium TaxID=325217 RepID=UPI003338D9F6
MAKQDRTPMPDFADIARLVMAAAGAALVGYGAWLHYPPLGFATGGGLLFAVAFVGGLRAK